MERSERTRWPLQHACWLRVPLLAASLLASMLQSTVPSSSPISGITPGSELLAEAALQRDALQFERASTLFGLAANQLEAAGSELMNPERLPSLVAAGRGLLECGEVRRSAEVRSQHRARLAPTTLLLARPPPLGCRPWALPL